MTKAMEEEQACEQQCCAMKTVLNSVFEELGFALQVCHLAGCAICESRSAHLSFSFLIYESEIISLISQDCGKY